MFDRIISFSLKNKFTMIFLTLAVAAWCILGLKDLAIDAVPDITNVQVQINVKTGALDPENIEIRVTRNLETTMSDIPHLTDMRSISKFGLAQVTLVFEDGTDITWARQQVSERMGRVELPEGTELEMAPVTTGLGEVYMYTLEVSQDSPLSKVSEKERLTELRTIQDYTVRPHLKRVKGVAEVDSNGGFVKQIHINFLPGKMEGLGITLNQLVSKLQSLGVNAGGGYIQAKGEQVIVRSYTEVANLDEISSLSLGISASGKIIKLKDIAEVRVDHSLRVGAATHRGKEAVLGTVLMRVGSNGRMVVQGVEEALVDLKLPQGITLVPLYTRKFLVDNTIRTVVISLAEGAILVIIVLLVLLGSVKAALIVSMAIPLSMLVALKGMNLLGITGNLMSLGAIDFGLLVDGSVVVIEAILARGALMAREDHETTIKKASSDVMGPVVAGIILIIAVYLPILGLEGVEGKMFRPMAITVMLALAASLATAVFLMPLFARLFLKAQTHGDGDHDTWFFRKAKNLFEPVLSTALARPLPFFAGAGILMILSIIPLTRMGSDFVPELDEGDLVLGLTRNTRIAIDNSVQGQLKDEEIIAKFPEVKDVFARIGTPESATDPMGVNLADTFIILEKDRSKWRFNSKDELVEAISKALKAEDPATDVSATQPIAMRFNEMLEGSRADLSLRILGTDLNELYSYGTKAEELLLPLQGVESIEQDPLTALRKGPVMDIVPDFTKLAALGITLEQFNSSLKFALAGEEVGNFLEKGIRFPIVVHMDERLRDNQQNIEKLPIELPLGGTVPLNSVSRLENNEKVTTIARNWGRRYSAISINVSGRDIKSFVDEAKSVIDKELKVKPGYEIHWGGQFKNMERANARLMIIVPLTLGMVFLILLRVFGTLGPALLVFSSVPFAGVGGIFALWSRGINFSVSAGVGFIALIGIALLNSLVLISVLLKESSEGDLVEAVKRGTTSRLRPVLMTAMVAGLGFLPMAINKGLGAEVQRPLATVVIGGLVTSTFLTLVLMPVAFKLWRQRGLRK